MSGLVKAVTADSSVLAALPLIEGIAFYQDRKTLNTNGGTFTQGAWRTRDITTEVSDPQNLATLSSNQLTVASAGNYLLWCVLCADQVATHRSRVIRNPSSPVVLFESVNAYTSTTSGVAEVPSILVGRFNLPSANEVLEIQHYCGSTRATNGFGGAFNFGDHEVYLSLMLAKLKN